MTTETETSCDHSIDLDGMDFDLSHMGGDCPYCIIGELEQRLHNVREIYAWMEGFMPETAPEGYCLRIIEQMYRATLPEPPQEAEQ